MGSFGSVRLTLGKDVNKGDQESLQSLFHAMERFRPIVVEASAPEDANIRVGLGGLGGIDLKLGDDMEKGQQKTVMTLFWFEERAKPIQMKRDAKAGESVQINMFLAP